MNQIHPTAILHTTNGPVILDDGIEIGPYAVIFGPVRICTGVAIAPHAVIGLAGEHRTEESDWEAPILIGAGTVIREHVVVQRGLVGGNQTRIGNRCYIMHGAHVAHDCLVGDYVTLSPFVVLGGHTVVGEGATMGIGSATHQRRIVGAWSMVGMGAVVIRDVPRGRKVAGVPARDIGENTIGLERAAQLAAKEPKEPTT